MIFWAYPSLGGMEYVSNATWKPTNPSSFYHGLFLSFNLYRLLSVPNMYSWHTLSGNPSPTVTCLCCICHAFWGRAAVHIHGSHLWKYHTRNQPTMVSGQMNSFEQLTKNLVWILSSFNPPDLPFYLHHQGSLMLLGWKAPKHTLSMELLCLLLGW